MQNPVLEAIKTRRSVRKFKAQAVPQELIDQVIEAGTYAASGKSKQPWLVVEVTDPAIMERMRTVNAQFQAHPQADPFYGAPVYLVVLSLKENPNHVYDGTLMLGNMMLAAHSLGLGSCWINRCRETFELPEWQDWLRQLGVEGEYEGIGNLALGFPEGEPAPAKPRKPCVVKVCGE